MKSNIIFTAIVILAFSMTFLIGRSFRVSQIPNGDEFGCANCHLSSGGGGPTTPFGTEIESNFLTAPGGAGSVEWGPDLAALDSDGDGFTNGEELQDPDGTWTSGSPAPGDPMLVTNPGDASSFPEPNAVKLDDFLPDQFVLHNNYPNPFNPETVIEFSISEPGNIRLEVFNTLGQSVRVLEEGYFASGNYRSSFNGKDSRNNPLNSGLYFYRLSSESGSIVKKMLLQK